MKPEPEILGRYPDLAREVRRLLNWYGNGTKISSRAAWRKTGISHTTITALAAGDRPSMEIVVKFAEGMKSDVNRLLRAAGYPELAAPKVPVRDPLSKIGPNVDITQLRSLPFANMAASAGEAALLGDRSEADETLGDQIPSDVRTIRVEGDCMHPFYKHNDLLLVREQESADPGQTVIAMLDDDVVVCKKFSVEDDRPYLEAVNGYQKIEGRFRIVGVVVGYFRFGGT